MLWLYRLLLRLQPERVRRLHGREMLQTFTAAVARVRADRGRSAALFEAFAECLDVVRTALAARRATTRLLRPSAVVGALAVVPTLLEWRRAVRRLASQPTFALVIVAALALGIGANTVVFSVADAVLFRGVPYPNGSRLQEVFNQPLNGRGFSPLLPPVVEEWRRQHDVFERVEGFNYGSFVVTAGDEPQTLPGAYVTPGLFAMLGVRPQLGRLFEPGEDSPGRDHIVLLSDSLWRRVYGADPGVIGRRVLFDDLPHEIVGVMPRGFRFPAAPQQLWVPAAAARGARNARLQAVALLPATLSVEQVQQRADAVAAALQQAQPLPAGWGVRLMPLRGAITSDTTQRGLQILLVAVAFVLLIACANVANLFLASALARDREIAVRTALGASRLRIVRELLAEGLLLAGVGGLAAVAIAWWGVDAAVALAPERITRWHATEIRLDGRVLAFTGIVSLLTGLVCALLPALRASRQGAARALVSRTATGGGAQGRLRGVLVVGEVALSVVLLVGAALLIRSFAKLQAVDLGFDPRGVVQVTLSLAADRYSSETHADFFRQLQETASRMPGVRAVTTGNGLPANGSIHFAEIEVEGRATTGKSTVMPGAAVASNYFQVFGVPMVRGRSFGADDAADTIIVSESLAARYWPAGDAIGARMRLGSRDSWKTVIGIAGEVRQEHLMNRVSEFEVYTPLWPKTAVAPAPLPRRPLPGARLSPVTLFVRSDRPEGLVPLLKQAVWQLDPKQPVDDGLLIEDGMARTLGEQRFARTLMALFAALALALAAAGLYALLSQAVVQRRHEIGVRLALGARTGDVLNLIMAHGMALTAAGTAIGLAAAWMTARYMQSQLYDTSAHDPLGFVAVALTMMLVAVVACWIPTRRALRVDPMVALRTE